MIWLHSFNIAIFIYFKHRLSFSLILSQNFEPWIDSIDPSFCVVFALKSIPLFNRAEFELTIFNKDSGNFFGLSIDFYEFFLFWLLWFCPLYRKIIVNDQVVKWILYECFLFNHSVDENLLLGLRLCQMANLNKHLFRKLSSSFLLFLFQFYFFFLWQLWLFELLKFWNG